MFAKWIKIIIDNADESYEKIEDKKETKDSATKSSIAF